jgi:hypothetical protein
MRKCIITVYDYTEASKGGRLSQFNSNNPPEVVEFNVEAWCVGGKEGVRAYWIQDDRLYQANGDDGHWELISVIHIGWTDEIVEALQACQSNHQRECNEETK